MIDVRTRPKYDISHIPGTTNVPFSQFTAKIDDLDIRSIVVVVGEGGIISEQAAGLLNAIDELIAKRQ